MASFEVAEYLDVFRDPFGHYHHYLVLVGHLAVGSLRPGGVLALPTRRGGRLVVRVLGLDGGFRKGPMSVAYAAPDTLGVCCWAPAAPSELLSSGTAMGVTEDHRIPSLRDALACSDRAALLHAIRCKPEERRYFDLTDEDGPLVCVPCLDVLRDVPDLGPLLHSALTDPRDEVIAAAVHALAKFGTPEDIERSRPLAEHSAAGIRAEVARTFLLRPEAPGRKEVLDRLTRDGNIRVRKAAGSRDSI